MAQPGSPAEGMRCLCATMRRASRLLTRRYEEALRPAGVSPSQFELMMTLRHAGRTDQPRLARLLATDQTTLSRNLRVLERERWVEGVRDGGDARRRVYGLTPLGGSVLAEAQRCWSGAHADMERRLGGSMGALWPTLDRIVEVAGSISAEEIKEPGFVPELRG